MDPWIAIYVGFAIGWLYGLVWGLSKKVGIVVLVGMILFTLYGIAIDPANAKYSYPWYVNVGIAFAAMIGCFSGEATIWVVRGR